MAEFCAAVDSAPAWLFNLCLILFSGALWTLTKFSKGTFHDEAAISGLERHLDSHTYCLVSSVLHEHFLAINADFYKQLNASFDAKQPRIALRRKQVSARGLQRRRKPASGRSRY